MALQVGSAAPRIEGTTYNHADDQFKPVSLDNYKDRWLCLYFFPAAFSALCPTEVAAFDATANDFNTRDCDLLGCSCDSHYALRGWCQATKDLANTHHPLLSDVTKRVAMDYGVLLAPKGMALRGVFLIDPEGLLRHTAVHDMKVAPNVAEVLRVLDALQSGGLCPSQWHKGDPTLPT
jgi:alkyl hydroperoxide reductase subunit AhpC